MFKKNFIDLCNKKGEAPSVVCKKVGIAPATFSCWTEKTVPRQATLYRIADYFGVTPEYLLKDRENEPVTPQEADELYKMYEELPEEAKAKAREYIELLLLQQKSEKK